MKNKHKRQFNNAFPWWDYGYLLQAMHTWLLAAEKGHKTKGISLNSPKKACRIKVARLMCERAMEDWPESDMVFIPEVDCQYNWKDVGNGYSRLEQHDYKIRYAGGDWQECSEQTYRKYLSKRSIKNKKHKEYLVKAFFEYVGKHIQTWWD